MKSILIILIVLAVSYSPVASNENVKIISNRDSSRIYGGYPIEISDAPYMVHITYHKFRNSTFGIDSLCGGSIIGKRFVLTAGHCATDPVDGVKKARNAANYTIRIGSSYSDQGGDSYSVSHVYPNPKYTEAAAYYDMAILKTERNIMFNYNTANKRSTVHRITLARPEDKIRNRDKVFSAGWGRNPDDPDTDQLYKVDLRVVGSRECARKWGDTAANYEQHEVCAAGEDRDVCKGDSGGPLVHKSTGRQIGVVSFGATCADNPSDLPGVYSKIQDNLDFIRSVTESKN